MSGTEPWIAAALVGALFALLASGLWIGLALLGTGLVAMLLFSRRAAGE